MKSAYRRGLEAVAKRSAFARTSIIFVSGVFDANLLKFEPGIVTPIDITPIGQGNAPYIQPRCLSSWKGRRP